MYSYLRNNVKYTLSVILVAQKLVALIFRDDKMYWEYS
jgi:hypothetical protein